MGDIRDDLMEAAEDLTELNTVDEVEEAATEDLPQTDVEDDVEDVTDDVSEEAAPQEEASIEETEEDVPEPLQWVAEMRQKWGELPKDVRKYINQREAQQHAYISKIGGQFAQMRRNFEEVDLSLIHI